ncbi:MAG: response regulator [Nitrospira sp.]|nr:response regulator [Nitrospira sp.]
MAQPLRVLLLEDLDTDAELMVRELKRAGFDPTWDQVDTEDMFLKCLEQPYELILSDNTMPSFDALRALKRLQERQLDIPVIIVSGSIGEEQAVSLLHHGAADYIMKDRIHRLGAAVEHVLEQKRLRNDNRLAHAALRARTKELIESQERLRALASDLTLTEQRERRKVAGDLHDYLAQLLVAGRMKLRRAAASMTDSSGSQLLQELDQIFQDSLQYTRTLIADLAPPALQEFGLTHALQWLSEHMRPHGLTVEVHVNADRINLPDDQAILIFQSVRELLLNVVKHGGTNHAMVAVETTSTELLITVTDGGHGFDPSVMADHDSAASSRFGLFSIHERMSAMGGRQEISSAPGRGTKVSLVLPYWPIAQTAKSGDIGKEKGAMKEGQRLPTRRPPLSPQLPQESAVIRVLLVDDHVMVRHGIKSLLEGHEHFVVIGEASDGQQALAMTLDLRPDVVIMDVNLPVLDGIAATRQITRDCPETVVVALSVHGDRHVMESMHASGAAAFVSKAAVMEELYEAIERALLAREPLPSNS